jgi:enoyl-[acyl-carrier protein] reductase II
MLGVQGVQVGTRFLVANECTVHENYKKKVLSAKDIDAVVTGRSTGHPIRVLKNKLSRQFQKLEKENAPVEDLEVLGRGCLPRAVKEGDIEMGSVMAGQIAGLIKKEQSCSEIIEEMFAQAEETIKKFNKK